MLDQKRGNAKATKTDYFRLTNLSAVLQTSTIFSFCQLVTYPSFFAVRFFCCCCFRLCRVCRVNWMQIKQNFLMTTLDFTIMIIKKTREATDASIHTQTRRKKAIANQGRRKIKVSEHTKSLLLIVFRCSCTDFVTTTTYFHWLMSAYLMFLSSPCLRICSLFFLLIFFFSSFRCV